MTVKLRFLSNDPISLEEYVCYVENNVDPDDSESVLASAEMLHHLGSNKSLLNNFILEPAKRMTLDSQAGNQALEASLKLAETRDDRFLVRANIWKIPEERGGSLGHEKRLYSYDAPHDHNFDFLTFGFYGPGYTTDVWQYDYHSDLQTGDKVDLKYVGRDSLQSGDIMFYKKSRDVHAQYPPEDLSISINLLVKARDVATRQQFYFDVRSNTVAGMVVGPTLRRKELMDIAGALAIQDAVEPLIEIAMKYPCKRTRHAAMINAIKIAPGAKAQLERSMDTGAIA